MCYNQDMKRLKKIMILPMVMFTMMGSTVNASGFMSHLPKFGSAPAERAAQSESGESAMQQILHKLVEKKNKQDSSYKPRLTVFLVLSNRKARELIEAEYFKRDPGKIVYDDLYNLFIQAVYSLHGLKYQGSLKEQQTTYEIRDLLPRSSTGGKSLAKLPNLAKNMQKAARIVAPEDWLYWFSNGGRNTALSELNEFLKSNEIPPIKSLKELYKLG